MKPRDARRAGDGSTRSPRRLPEWLRVRAPQDENIHRLQGMLSELGLNTVCESAVCPNRRECFARGTATFMILGRICTRGCRFCAVERGRPEPPNPEEPARVARAVSRMGIAHAVVTSVTRDDLPDGGAEQFARTVEEIRGLKRSVTVEVLIPDFGGDLGALARVVEAGPEIINHNLETVPRLYERVRPGADYSRSLELISRVRDMDASIHTKSGLMLGLGERRGEVVAVMGDLRGSGCDILTLGQYLQPSREHLPVKEYIRPGEFDSYAELGRGMGFAYTASAPLVRSSFGADRAMEALRGDAGGED